jgi:uncharacterized protein (DUF1330 family)
MAAYVVLDVAVQDPRVYDEYKDLAPASIAEYGGRYLARGGSSETLEGGWSPSRLVILEFPTMERARSWWASREYGPARTLRQASAHTNLVVVEGVSSAVP